MKVGDLVKADNIFVPDPTGLWVVVRNPTDDMSNVLVQSVTEGFQMWANKQHLEVINESR